MRKIFVWITVLISISLLFLLSCTPKPSSETGLKTIQEPAAPVAQKTSAETEWDKTFAMAKKEGLVVLYGASGISQAREPFVRAMKEKFGITLDVTVAGGPQLTAKLENERRAGLYLPDVYMGGTQSMAISMIPQKMLEPIEPYLILPEVKDPSRWFLGKLPIWDKGRQVLASVANITSFMAINLNMARPEELTSFRDILKPKFRGQILMLDPSQPGSNWFQSATLLMGQDYFKEFLNQDIVLTRDIRFIQDSLTRGKYAIGIGVNMGGITAARKDGAPIDVLPVLKEGTVVVVGAGNIAVMNNRPHPNAAKVFVNWVLSKEGQTVLSRANSQASRRLDVPTEHLYPWQVPDAKMRYIFETEEDYMNSQGKYFEQAKELFSPLLR